LVRCVRQQRPTNPRQMTVKPEAVSLRDGAAVNAAQFTLNHNLPIIPFSLTCGPAFTHREKQQEASVFRRDPNPRRRSPGAHRGARLPPALGPRRRPPFNILCPSLKCRRNPRRGMEIASCRKLGTLARFAALGLPGGQCGSRLRRR